MKMMNYMSLLALLFVSIGCGDKNVTLKSFLSNGGSATEVIDATISNLSVNNVTMDSFTVSTNFLGSEDTNSIVRLSYCNLTDLPGCEPTTDLGLLDKGTDNFFKEIVSGTLGFNDNPGDFIRIRAAKEDVNGAQGEYLDYVVVLALDAVNHVYRSVGPGSTSALATGIDNKLVIVGDIAVFESALPANVGVGDVIQYDADEDGSIDSLAFILSRINNQTYRVNSAQNLSVPEVINDTDWSVFRAYTSINNAESGNENSGIDNTVRRFENWASGNDLVASGLVWNIALYADAPETTAGLFFGWTTSKSNYLRVFSPSTNTEVGVSQRHNGVWSNTKSRVEVTNGYPLYFLFGHVVVEGIQIKLTVTGNSANFAGIRTNILNNIVVRNNIIVGDLQSTGLRNRGMQIFSSATDSTSFVINNLVYGFENGPKSMGIHTSGNGNYFVYNNTVIGADTAYLSTTKAVLKNNIAQDVITSSYSGTEHADSDHNLTNLTDDVPGSNSLSGVTLNFVDKAAGNFKLNSTDTAAIDSGINLTVDIHFPFVYDIENMQRVGDWERGAFNF